jgi:hypothetical protein
MDLSAIIPHHGCCCCIVLYGQNAEYLVLALVLARRLLRISEGKYPLLVLPTADVPREFRRALETVGCFVCSDIERLRMHPDLLRSAEGRHCCALTKLQVLGLECAHIKKILLVDVDILPCGMLNLDAIFNLDAPAALLSPANLMNVRQLQPGEKVPNEWLAVSGHGIGARFNAGVMLLTPNRTLLQAIIKEVGVCVSPSWRRLNDAEDVVSPIFGHPWRPTWTPEEDALTRAMLFLFPGTTWTHLGASYNFEVEGRKVYFADSPMAAEHASLALNQVAMLHFVGSRKPSYYAWYLARGTWQRRDIECWLRQEHRSRDPDYVIATATMLWLEAFVEMLTYARVEMQLDVLNIIDWPTQGMIRLRRRLHHRSRSPRSRTRDMR